MNPLAILLALTFSCFLVAACIAAWLLYDWHQLRRGLREDQELDHWPVRGEPRWMRRSTNNWIHKP